MLRRSPVKRVVAVLNLAEPTAARIRAFLAQRNIEVHGSGQYPPRSRACAVLTGSIDVVRQARSASRETCILFIAQDSSQALAIAALRAAATDSCLGPLDLQ